MSCLIANLESHPHAETIGSILKVLRTIGKRGPIIFDREPFLSDLPELALKSNGLTCNETQAFDRLFRRSATWAGIDASLRPQAKDNLNCEHLFSRVLEVLVSV